MNYKAVQMPHQKWFPDPSQQHCRGQRKPENRGIEQYEDHGNEPRFRYE